MTSAEGRRDEGPSRRLTWLALASFGALVFLLWLPFDLRRTPLVEWWSSHGVYDQVGFPLATSGMFKTRPLAALPYYLGYSLTPDSYVGGTVFLAILIFARMAIPYWVGRRIAPERPALAYVFALLFALYPADSMQFALRAVGSHFTVVCYLAATAFLVSYWFRPRLLSLTAMWLSLAIGLLSAPTPYGAVLITPILLWHLQGGISRRVVRVSLLWWAVPALVVLYIFLSSITAPGENYLDRLWIWHGGMSPYKWKSLLLSAGLVYWRHFVAAWVGAVGAVTTHPTFAVWSLGIAFAAGFVIHRHLQKPPGEGQLELSTAGAGRLALLGAAITFAGFLPFWPTSARLVDWRVYLVSPLGASLVLLALFLWLDGLTENRGRLFVGASTVCVGLAIFAAFSQTARFQEASRLEQRLLAEIVTQAPSLRGEATVAVLPAGWKRSEAISRPLPAAFASDHFLYPHGFADALRYLYGDYRRVEGVAICSSTTRATCSFTDAGLVADGRFSFPLRPVVVDELLIPYEELLVFTLAPGGRLRLEPNLGWAGDRYDPGRLIDAEAPLPERYSTLLVEEIASAAALRNGRRYDSPHG